MMVNRRFLPRLTQAAWKWFRGGVSHIFIWYTGIVHIKKFLKETKMTITIHSHGNLLL